jgi:hypothetical protein
MFEANSEQDATRLPLSTFLMGERGKLVASWWQVGGKFLLLQLEWNNTTISIQKIRFSILQLHDRFIIKFKVRYIKKLTQEWELRSCNNITISSMHL